MEVVERIQARAVKNDFSWKRVLLRFSGFMALMYLLFWWFGSFILIPTAPPDMIFEIRMMMFMMLTIMSPLPLLLIVRVEWLEVRWTAVEKEGIRYEVRGGYVR